jgi:hypothetical protein
VLDRSNFSPTTPRGRPGDPVNSASSKGPELVTWVRIRVRRWRMSAQNGRWKDRMSQSDLDAVDRGIPAIAFRGKKFARDSALEQRGFELPVPP